MSRPRISCAHRITWGTVSLALVLGIASAGQTQDVESESSPGQSQQSDEVTTAEQKPRPDSSSSPHPPAAPSFLFQRGPDGRLRVIMPNAPTQHLPQGFSWQGLQGDPMEMRSEEERYLIGVALAPIQIGLHKRLGIDEGQGLLVTEIDEELPAAEAGIEKHDIILQVNGATVSDPNHVADMVKDSAGSTLTLSLLRDEGTVEIEVVPVKKLMTTWKPAMQDPAAGPNWEDILSRLQGVEQEMQLVGPGVVMEESAAAPNADVEQLRKQVEALSQQQEEVSDKLEKLIEMLSAEDSAD